MTSSANNEWDYYKLIDGLHLLERLTHGLTGSFQYESIMHTIKFIEYNMKEMEITGGNGD
jgi:hypothetical protein